MPVRTLVAWLMALEFAGGAFAAEPVENIRSRVTEPVAVRGGVLMLPLEASEGTSQWPQTLQLRTADGVTIDGMVVWIHPVPTAHERRWTDDPRGLGIRMVTPEDDLDRVNPMLGEGPHLVARLPTDGEGSLKLGKQTLKPRWVAPQVLKSKEPSADFDRGDFADDELAAPNEAPLATAGRSGDALPDPDSPFEHWRWMLLANQPGESPEIPMLANEAAALAAEHFTGLWMLGLVRLQAADESTADRLMEMLMRTCADRGHEVAAWVADPRAVTSLLDRLVDMERSDESIARDAKLWMEMLPPVVVWPAAEFGPTVELRAMTLADEPVLASFRWEGLSSGSTVVRLEPSVVTHVEIERPPLPAPGAVGMAPPPEPRRQTLIISAGRMESRIEFGARTIDARPPGVLFGTLNAPITLAEAQARFRRALPVEWRTSAQVRRLSGRWEVFVECLRPSAGRVTNDELGLTSEDSATGSGDQQGLGEIKSLDDVRGIEAITLLLGDEGGDAKDDVWLTIPEDGWQQIVRGQNDGTLQVHRRSLADRWFCRIVLPEAWVPLPDNGALQIALIRSHGDSDQLETSPGISTPWQPEPARAFIDLSHWDDLTPGR